eukprot:scaffold212538_cov23-Cyclotella_meneghiniana.AAC.1
MFRLALTAASSVVGTVHNPAAFLHPWSTGGDCKYTRCWQVYNNSFSGSRPQLTEVEKSRQAGWHPTSVGSNNYL